MGLVACSHLRNGTGNMTATMVAVSLVVRQSMKRGFIVKQGANVLNIYMCVCVCAHVCVCVCLCTCVCVCTYMKGCMQGTVWIEQDKCESMLYLKGHTQYVEGVLQGVLG